MPRAAPIVVQTVNYPCLKNREYHNMYNHFRKASAVRFNCNKSKVKLFCVDTPLKRSAASFSAQLCAVFDSFDCVKDRSPYFCV